MWRQEQSTVAVRRRGDSSDGDRGGRDRARRAIAVRQSTWPRSRSPEHAYTIQSALLTICISIAGDANPGLALPLLALVLAVVWWVEAAAAAAAAATSPHSMQKVVEAKLPSVGILGGDGGG